MKIGQGDVPAPGTGKTIGDVALYNDNGSVRGMSSTCTHAGCQVEWNDEHKSFDCPCHGSVFNSDGSVQKGPAEEPLAPVEIEIA